MFSVQIEGNPSPVMFPRDALISRIGQQTIQLNLDKYHYLVEKDLVESNQMKMCHTDIYGSPKMRICLPKDALLIRVKKDEDDPTLLFGTMLPKELDYDLFKEVGYVVDDDKRPFAWNTSMWLSQPSAGFEDVIKGKDILVISKMDDRILQTSLKKGREKAVLDIFKPDSDIVKMLSADVFIKDLLGTNTRIANISVGKYPYFPIFRDEFIFVNCGKITLTTEHKDVVDSIHGVVTPAGWNLNVGDLKTFLAQLNPNLSIEIIDVLKVVEAINEFCKDHAELTEYNINELDAAFNALGDKDYWIIGDVLYGGHNAWSVKAILHSPKIQDLVDPKYLPVIQDYLDSCY